jgi:hypothetical protein
MATEVCPPTIKSSPWGAVQHQTNFAPGVDQVSTAGHGGIKLDRKQNARIPDLFRLADGWYEEDCDAAIPIYFLAAPDFTAERKAAAEKSLKTWHWKQWEAWSGQTFAPGECRFKDEEEWKKAHRDRFVVVSALRLDKDTVGVKATREADGAEAWFKVPDGEYTHRGMGFAVDETRHERASGPLFWGWSVGGGF